MELQVEVQVEVVEVQVEVEVEGKGGKLTGQEDKEVTTTWKSRRINPEWFESFELLVIW